MARVRDDFPTLAHSTHLISHSLGAMPKGGYERLKAFGDAWVNQSIEAWREWLPMVRRTGDEIAGLIGAPAGTVAVHQNVSSWMGIIASCLTYTPERNRVVYTDMNFPSVHYVWKEQERLGARVDIVRSDDRITVDTQKFIDAIDDRTAAVVVELVLFRSGYIQDAKAICRAAQAKGALAIIDAYQAVGTVPVDVVDIDCDFLTGGSVKWLCGGPGAAYCYVKQEHIRRMEPYLCGWFSHEAPFGFVFDRIRYSKDVSRFLGGTPSIPAIYASAAGRSYIRDIGIRRIREKSIRQTGLLIEMADDLGLKVNTPRHPSQRGGMVCVDFPGAEEAHRRLLKRRFLLDYRPRCGIRLSPHFYTTDAELEAVMKEISRLRRAT
ncbi:MAG: aminotransferase class V-fold PLP-dependent enzyme [Planctomycetes bacterium]|nr:aminotransferase class V-fold PLP-dependent enzyme [Planctomycetota bacterium]